MGKSLKGNQRTDKKIKKLNKRQYLVHVDIVTFLSCNRHDVSLDRFVLFFEVVSCMCVSTQCRSKSKFDLGHW